MTVCDRGAMITAAGDGGANRNMEAVSKHRCVTYSETFQSWVERFLPSGVYYMWALAEGDKSG